MIGIGTWVTTIKSMVFTGDITVVISNNDGVYNIDFQLPEKYAEKLKITTHDIVENGNTLSGKGAINLLPGKELGASVTFNGDTFEGYLDIPFMKRQIPLRNGHKIAD